MKGRLLALLVIGALLVACDPGEPDIDYGRHSVATLPFGSAIGADGSAYGLEVSGRLGVGARVHRLDPAGRVDARWSAVVEGMPDAVIPAADGSAWVLTYGFTPTFGHLLARIRPDGTVAWDDVHLGDVVILDRTATVAHLSLAVNVIGGGRVSTELWRVAGDGAITRSVLRTEPLHSTTSLEAQLAPDGSVTMWGFGQPPDRAWLRRVRPDGTPDTSFGVDGTADLDSFNPGGCGQSGAATLGEVIARSNAGPWLVWQCDGGAMTIGRLTAAGQLDTTWSAGWWRDDALPVDGTVTRFHPAGDGSGLVEVRCLEPSEGGCDDQDPASLVRLLPSGALDDAWGDGGVAPVLIDPLDVVSTTAGVMVWGSNADGELVFHRLVRPVVSGQAGS